MERIVLTQEKLTCEDCLLLLQEKQQELRERGEKRYAARGDFLPHEVMAIKAHLGPWPRALEAAGIKPVRADDRAERNLQKHIRAKRARNEARRAARTNKYEPTVSGGQKQEEGDIK